MRRKFGISIAILLLATAGFACSMLRQKRPADWLLTLEIDAPPSDREAALKQTVEVIESRLNALGVPGYEVKAQGDPAIGRIIVGLRGGSNPERLKSVITARGKLEVTAVVSPPSPRPCQTYATKADAIATLNSRGTIPTNRRVLPYAENSGQEQPTKWVVVESPSVIDGNDLRSSSAVPRRDSDDYYVQFALKKTGADRFSAWTAANIDTYLGVVLNDEVKSIAYIKSQISEQGVIAGSFTKESAEDLALVLRSGSLPFPVKIVNESFVQWK